MSSIPQKKNHRPASLRASGGARSVLLRMAADQERADRIRALKQERPDLTWRRIADYVGVTERSANDWQKKGGIEYANAEKLAKLFEVDVDYIWRGPAHTAPDLSNGARNGAQDESPTQLDRIEAKLDRVLSLLTDDELAPLVRAVLHPPATPAARPATPRRTARAKK